MMKPGDLIFYPLQGAAIVKDLKLYEFSGQYNYYYQISIPLNKLNVLIPYNKVEDIGIRPISTPDYLDRSRAIFFERNSKLPLNSKERRFLLQRKLKSGSLAAAMETVRDLICSENHLIRFNYYDRYILEIAIRMLTSEIMYIENISYKFAKHIVKDDIKIRLSGNEKYFYK